MKLASAADTAQDRKKQQLLQVLRQLIERVEAEELYGEFGVVFMAQAGKIGHFEEQTKRTFK